MEKISSRKLKALVKDARALKADVSELNGAFGNQIKDAKNNHHLHLKAFRAAVMEDRMEPEAYGAYRDHLDYYREELGLNEKAASAPRMEMGEERNETNVADFPAPVSVEA